MTTPRPLSYQDRRAAAVARYRDLAVALQTAGIPFTRIDLYGAATTISMIERASDVLEALREAQESKA